MARTKRRVKQLYIDGVEKAEYNSITDALHALGKTRMTDMTHIIDVCKGRRKTAFGYIWVYV